MFECENDTDSGLSFATENKEKPKPEPILGMCLHQFFIIQFRSWLQVEKPFHQCVVVYEKVEKGVNYPLP